jgi:hypothetical protein
MIIQYLVDRIIRLGRLEYNIYELKVSDQVDGNTILSRQDYWIRRIRIQYLLAEITRLGK